MSPRRAANRLRARLGAGLAALSLAVIATGCAAGASTPERVSIVATTNILGDVTSQIVGDAAEVTTLMQPNADPHSFEISAQQAAAMDRASLVVSNGLGLEEGLQQHLDRVAAAGGSQFIAGAHVRVLDYGATPAAAAGTDDGRPLVEQSGVTAAPDPHFWTDPQQMIAVVRALTAEVSSLPALSADARAAITKRGTDYLAELAALDDTLTAELDRVPQDRRALVTNHHVFGYFAARYDFRILGTAIPGGTTLAAPSAADLSDLVRAITEAGVPTIFAESSAPDRLMRVLAAEAGIEVRVVPLFTESLTPPGGGAATYIDMLTENTTRIVDGLAPPADQPHPHHQ